MDTMRMTVFQAWSPGVVAEAEALMRARVAQLGLRLLRLECSQVDGGKRVEVVARVLREPEEEEAAE